MDEREMARALAMARVGVGAGLFALPGLSAATWVGRDAQTAGVRTFSRGFVSHSTSRSGTPSHRPIPSGQPMLRQVITLAKRTLLL